MSEHDDLTDSAWDIVASSLSATYSYAVYNTVSKYVIKKDIHGLKIAVMFDQNAPFVLFL